ncbi:TlpA family protein disulfide reductase [candidate division TA06 bacterium]|uniref:TlpA family protein disulfide reductase n=1 Tax=candidate division TA06 bacterium TaxID=2250710 RepID=A0A933I6R9_UNCT6|nr:TlpA family protein disulfide reductase [candidate division TA06 bacterium]
MKNILKFYLALLAFTAPALEAQIQPGLEVGAPAPPIVLKNLDGGSTFYLRDYCGQPRTPRTRQQRDVVVLSFFTTWCENCKKEIPCLQEMASKFSQDSIRFYLINVGEPKDSVEAYIFQWVISLPILHDEFSATAKKYQANNMPTLAVVDKAGRIAEYHAGFVDGYEKELEAKLNLLLGKTKPESLAVTLRPGSVQSPDSAIADTAKAKAKPKVKGKKGKIKKSG